VGWILKGLDPLRSLPVAQTSTDHSLRAVLSAKTIDRKERRVNHDGRERVSRLGPEASHPA